MKASARVKKTAQYAAALVVVSAALSNWGFLEDKAAAVVNGLSAIQLPGGVQGVGSIQAEAALLMDERTGQILYAKNEHERLYPASTTKILTALVAIKLGDPDALVTVGDEVNLRTPGESTAGLREGETLSFGDLLSAMLLPSGNDAARTVARYIASEKLGRAVGAEEGIAYFAGLMNAEAARLGATESHFVNPHGLHDPDHYTTAHDLAIIAKAARKNALFRQIVAETEHDADSGDTRQTYVNRNQLLQKSSPYYDKEVSGIKTGYTDKAGYCLVASASRSSNNLIAVVLHSTADQVWTDAESMLQYGFASLRTKV